MNFLRAYGLRIEASVFRSSLPLTVCSSTVPIPRTEYFGLSIVAAVAEAHGGEVSARSEPGKGSTFRITLPLAS